MSGKKVEKKEMDAYLAEARSWETDKVREAEKSKKLAWRVAMGSGVMAFMAVAAVTVMMPLKQVEPYVIRVDNSTGIVDVVSAMTDAKTNYDESINKYFAQKYVRYREGYTRDLADEYYNYVGLLSSSTEQQKYYAGFNPKNPQSPLNLYGATAKVNITIIGTTFIAPNIALVRYVKSVQRGLDQPENTHWAATITFRYAKAPMSEKDRAVNPLGFQVMDYRNDPETTGPTTNDQAATAPQPAAPANAGGVVVMPGQTAPATSAAKPQ